MSLDKDSNHDVPQIPPGLVRRSIKFMVSLITFGPLVFLPALLLAALTWGVCGRIVWEMFKYAWGLFGWV